MPRLFTHPIDRPEKSITDLLSQTIMIGFSTGNQWQLDSFGSLMSPRIEQLDCPIIYVPVITKSIVKRFEAGSITVSGKNYTITTLLDSKKSLLIESKLDHNTFLSPTLRSLGVYVDITYSDGVAEDKDYYTKDEISGSLFFAQSFKPIYKINNLTQAIKIVLLSSETTWYGDDIHFVNDYTFIY